MVDIDHFKTINDTYGHLIGDAVLRAVGAALVGGVRAGDVVARIGGDEFAVGLRDVTPAELVRLAERVRVADSTAADGWTVTEVSVSIGAAVSMLEPAAVGDLLAAADRALYEAKASGRDAVWLAVLAASTSPDDMVDSDGVVSQWLSPS